MRRANYIIFAAYGLIGAAMTFIFLHTALETNLRVWLIGIGVTLFVLSLGVISFTAFNEDADIHWFFKILITLGAVGAYVLVAMFFYNRFSMKMIGIEEVVRDLRTFLITSVVASGIVSLFFMYCSFAMRSAKSYLIVTILSPIISLSILGIVILFRDVIWVRWVAGIVGFFVLIALGNTGGESSSSSSSDSSSDYDGDYDYSDSSDDYETVEKTYVNYDGDERELEDIGGGQYRDDHGDIWNDNGDGYVYKDD